MKGPSEKGDQFAVLEYMKAGQVVTHPCAPLQKIEFFIRSPSPSPEPTSPPPPSPVAEVPAEPEVVAGGAGYHYRKPEGSLVNASDRPACQTISDRGVAMIPLPTWGRTLDWRKNQKSVSCNTFPQCPHNVRRTTPRMPVQRWAWVAPVGVLMILAGLQLNQWTHHPGPSARSDAVLLREQWQDPDFQQRMSDEWTQLALAKVAGGECADSGVQRWPGVRNEAGRR